MILDHHGEAESMGDPKMWNILVPSASAVILVFLGLIESGARFF
jgi:hypothetical protein